MENVEDEDGDQSNVEENVCSPTTGLHFSVLICDPTDDCVRRQREYGPSIAAAPYYPFHEYELFRYSRG